MAPLEVGMNDRAIDLLLGERLRLVIQAPLPPSLPPAYIPHMPGRDTPRPTLPGRIPTVAQTNGPACAVAPPNASLLNQTTPDAALPPAAGKYTFRTSGSVASGTTTTRLPATTTREVARVQAEPTGTFLYDVVTTVGVDTTSATFRIVPVNAGANAPQQLPSAAPGSRAQPGIYLVRVDRPEAVDFNVTDPGLKLVDFPVRPGATFTTAGTDGMTTMTFTSTVDTQRPRVDACGALVDAYQIDLVGQFTRATDLGTVAAEFSSSYDVATQFGGLIVQEQTEVTSDDVVRRINATINSVPAAGRHPGGAQ